MFMDHAPLEYATDYIRIVVVLVKARSDTARRRTST